VSLPALDAADGAFPILKAAVVDADHRAVADDGRDTNPRDRRPPVGAREALAFLVAVAIIVALLTSVPIALAVLIVGALVLAGALLFRAQRG